MSLDEKSDLVLDEEGGLRRVGGDREIYDELLDLFLGNSTVQLEKLKEAVKNNEADQIKRLAHSIKGAAANLGVVMVQQSALELEQLSSENRLKDIDKPLENLINNFERFKELRQN